MSGYPIFEPNYENYQKTLDYAFEGYEKIKKVLDNAKRNLTFISEYEKKEVANVINEIEEIANGYSIH